MSTSGERDQCVRIFVSYAHEDEMWKDKLVTATSVLDRMQLAVTWHDRKILAGSVAQSEIEDRLDSADIVLCLVSADFIASHYCYELEFERALRRKNSDDMHVIPVIVRPVADWQNLPLGKFQVLPKEGKPMTEWENPDRALAEVAEGVRQLVEMVISKRRDTPAPLQIGTADGPSVRPSDSQDVRRIIQFYVPDRQETQEDFVRMWKLLESAKHEIVSKNGWQLRGPCIGEDNLRQHMPRLPPDETILLVALDSKTLQDSDGGNWIEQMFAQIPDSEAHRRSIVGVVADGCSPELAFRVRDSGARIAIPLSRLGDPDWVWPSLDEMIRAESSRFAPPFKRGLGDLSKKRRNRIAVAGVGQDALEIRPVVKLISTRLTNRPPLMIDPKSFDELEFDVSELKSAPAVILRVRENHREGAADLGIELAARLSSMGAGKVKTFCVAKQREKPDWWGRRKSFAYYDYTCGVDLAFQLYEWLLVEDPEGEA